VATSNTPYRSVLLFGAPGAGKGTQGKMLGALPGFYHMSSGDMFRGLDPRSDLGKEITAIMASGELVPDELTVRLWKQHAAAKVADGSYNPAQDLLVLDGIPRNPNQADLMAGDIEVLAIVNLDATDRDALVARLKGRAAKEGRSDDAKEEVIRNRFRVFDAETAPMLGRYPAGVVHKIDPMGSPLAVLVRILEALVPIHDARLDAHI